MEEETNSMMLGGSCGVSSAACTGLGSGTFARLSLLGQNGREVWVKDWSQKGTAGLTTDQEMEKVEECVTCLIGVTQKSNQGSWVEQTMTVLLLVSIVGKRQMIAALKDWRQLLVE